MRGMMQLAAIVCVLLAVSACATTLKPTPPHTVSGGTQFLLSAPGATSVSLVGAFNGWSPTAHRMAPAGSDGIWSVVVPLPEGEHAFMYLINGTQWTVPPQAQDFVTDGFGNVNGIVVVR